MGRSTVIACLLLFPGLSGTARAAGAPQVAATAQGAAATAADATSCSTCHSDIVRQVKAHPHASAGKAVNCSDCHTMDTAHVRGSREMAAHKQPTIAEQNASCTRCHTEDAGPFAHQHPVVNAEGCGTCHAAHGSANPRMLTVASQRALCLQCHAQTTTQPTHASGAAPATQPVDCTTCHHQIHGSNTSEAFLQ
ncbi:MAG TPA: cytochrome c3 family protein [Acidobacteriaceae bacterium]|nr:cytochrome c3 family protein [Acidobacteriaceae bacterium]